jgi:hypothetical protein
MLFLPGCLGLASCQKKTTESQSSQSALAHAAFMDLNQVIGTGAISLADDNQKVVFAERFTSPLDAGWAWIREEPKAWEVENGTLLLRVLAGYCGHYEGALGHLFRDLR